MNDLIFGTLYVKLETVKRYDPSTSSTWYKTVTLHSVSHIDHDRAVEEFGKWMANNQGIADTGHVIGVWQPDSQQLRI